MRSQLPNKDLSRRSFVQRTAAFAAALAAGNLVPVRGNDWIPVSADGARFLFLTDIHLMADDALGSAAGLAACLEAVESLRPRPDFILCGGDLTHESPGLDYEAGSKLINRFLEIWHAHTSIPTHFTFGNHDFVGVKNALAAHDDPRFGKGLWRQRLGLDQSFYGFDAGGWRFLVLDDVGLNPDGSYTGEIPDEQLTFLKTEVAQANGRPLLLCGHIPALSVFPTVVGMAKLVGAKVETPNSAVVDNAKAVLDLVKAAQGDLKLVLAGHLHHYEKIELDGTCFINSGAVCGDWWKGAQLGCPEGYLVVDIQPDGKFTQQYHAYSWDAKSHQPAT